MKTLILILSVIASNPSFAKTLVCTDQPSFTTRDFSINRDGSIGFNGTYIIMNSPISFWGNGKRSILSDITGRTEDNNYGLRALTLAVSPKESCTNPDAVPGAPFKCSVKNATIFATGDLVRDNPKGSLVSFDQITIRSQLHADVDVALIQSDAPNGDKTLELRGTVNSTGKPVQFSIPVRSVKNACKVIDR